MSGHGALEVGEFTGESKRLTQYYTAEHKSHMHWPIIERGTLL
jgi:hypothetical protein